MTSSPHAGDTFRATPASARFATLTFERRVAAPPSVLWQAWTAPAARAGARPWAWGPISLRRAWSR